jgi:hypothetical protein
MASIYARGSVLWLKYRDETGKLVRKSTGYRVGQEDEARAFGDQILHTTLGRDGRAETRRSSIVHADHPRRIDSDTPRAWLPAPRDEHRCRLVCDFGHLWECSGPVRVVACRACDFVAQRCERHSHARAWEVISDGLSPGQRRIQELEDALAKAEARIQALEDERNARRKGRGIYARGKRLWCRLKKDGKWINTRTPYHVGQEELAVQYVVMTQRALEAKDSAPAKAEMG